MDDSLVSRQAVIDVINHELRCGAVIDQCGLETAHDLIEELPSAQPKIKTKFVRLTVRNSNGRPYYSIIYLEDGNEFEGYSSYSLDVISDYLKRYFEFAQPERKTGRWIDDHCSECGQYVFHEDVRNFCPNCGSPMEKDGEW